MLTSCFLSKLELLVSYSCNLFSFWDQEKKYHGTKGFLAGKHRKVMAQVNRQTEPNLHNLKPFRGHIFTQLFVYIFWMIFCEIIPIVNAVPCPFQSLLAGRFPIGATKTWSFLFNWLYTFANFKGNCERCSDPSCY